MPVRSAQGAGFAAFWNLADHGSPPHQCEDRAKFRSRRTPRRTVPDPPLSFLAMVARFSGGTGSSLQGGSSAFCLLSYLAACLPTPGAFLAPTRQAPGRGGNEHQ